MKCETFARRQNLCECAARKCNNAVKKLRENDEHSRKFCLRAKVSQFDLCERVNFHFAAKIPAKAACPQTAREKKRKNTIIIIYYILYIIYIYSSFSQKKFLFHFSADFCPLLDIFRGLRMLRVFRAVLPLLHILGCSFQIGEKLSIFCE